MYISVGLEIGKADEAIGLVVPALNIENYACYSAADDEQNIIPNVKEALALLLDDMSQNNPELIARIEDYGIRHYQKLSDYEDFNNWSMVEFDLSPYLGKQKRFNVSMSEGLIQTIDTIVDARPEYKDRSHFFEVAARHELTGTV
jgi:hypothetical protein